MFCGKCGSKILNGSNFCQECGTAMQNPAVHGNQDSIALSDTDAKAMYRKIGMIAVASAAAVVLLIVLLLCSGRGYKATVNRFIDSTFDCDIKGLVKILPKEAVEEVIEDDYDGDKKQFLKDGETALKSTIGLMELMYGDNVKVSHKITKVKDIRGDDLEDFQDDYEDEWDIKVSAVKRVTVEVTIKGKSDKTEEEMEIYLVKIGNSWYIDLESAF